MGAKWEEEEPGPRRARWKEEENDMLCFNEEKSFFFREEARVWENERKASHLITGLTYILLQTAVYW